MSSIDRLLIQGIRSFGCADHEKAVVKFDIPLTLITGQNGAGKTTIIECLKYITTGDLPPNSKQGAFVHDPKLVGEREVKGVVKLRFKDVAGSIVVCHRILQSTQKHKKIETKTLDTSMEKIIRGEKVKMTSKCGEVDREMIHHLGVSKAVLNNVIFCHQEDSYWPLSEGKQLKTKFDEIFASTRYSKALEDIKDRREQQLQDCKLHTTELQYIKQHKQKADELQDKLRESERKVAATTAEITRIKNELRPVEVRFQELNTLYSEVETLGKKLAELESARKELDRSANDLKKKIGSEVIGTYEDLKVQYENHRDSLGQDAERMKQLELSRQQGQREEQQVKHELNSFLQEQGRLESEEKHYRSVVEQRDKRVHALARQLKTERFTSGGFSPTEVQHFIGLVTKHKRDKEEGSRREKEEYLRKERELQQKIDELRQNQARLEQTKKLKEKTLEDNRRKISELSQDLSAIGSSGDVLEGIEQDLAVAEENLTEQRAIVDVASLERELQGLVEEKRRADDEVVRLQRDLTAISQQAGVRGALDAFRRDKKVKEEQLQNELLAMETGLFESVSAEEDLERQLLSKESNNKRELQSAVKKLQQLRDQLSRLQAQNQNTVKQLADQKSRQQVLQEELADVCGEGSYGDKMAQIREEIEKQHEDIAAVKGSQPFFKKCLDKVQTTKKCPLCTRGFADQTGVDGLVKSISARLNESIPRILPQLESKLQMLQEKQTQLQMLQPKIEELSKLKSEVVPGLERLSSEQGGKIQMLENDLQKVESSHAQLTSELEEIQSLQQKAMRSSQLRRDIRELDQKIVSESSKLAGVDGSRTHVTVNRELQEAQMKTKDLNHRMDSKRQEISTVQSSIRQLENLVHDLKEKKLKLQDGLQRRQAMVSQRSDCTAQNEALRKEIEDAVRRLAPLRGEVEEQERLKKECISERDEAMAISTEEVRSLGEEEKAIKSLSQDIVKYVDSRAQEKLEQCVSRVSELKGKEQLLTQKRGQLEQEIDKLQKQLANEKMRERKLEDSMQLRKLEKEIADKDQAVRKIREDMKKNKLDQYSSEYHRLQEDTDRLRKEEARQEGHRVGQEDQLRHWQKELQSDMYRDVGTRHYNMLVVLKTTQLACSDLEKYYRALDRAIMRFHKVKMEEINKIIKELWIKTYKGGDIDTIEIRSEDEEQDAVTAIKPRRTYNYRVVMIKGDTVLDMRGRCSAGQKVLACIVIRLALAETFCLSCGVMALDEPTTNLDHENVEGLAQALADIVRDRSKQKNFQLIVISHDEPFLELLSHSEYTEFYYRVSKPVNETSKIEKFHVSGLRAEVV
eukprot:Em0013g15a